MIKQNVAFKDFNGKELVEEFAFHLSKADVMEMQISQKGGLGEYMQQIVKEEDGEKLVTLFKKIIAMSVGKVSEDGRRFDRTEEITADFMSTNAYSELFVRLATDNKFANEFIEGIMPEGFAEMVAEFEASQGEPSTDEPPKVKSFHDFTRQQLLEMPAAQFESLVPSKPQDMSREQLQLAMERKNQLTS